MRTLFGLVVLFLAGCSPAAPALTAATPRPTAVITPSPRPAVTNGTLLIELFEWSIATDPIDVAPGTYEVTVVNQGRRPHSVTIAGAGSEVESRRLNGGGKQVLTVTFTTGEAILWCAIGDHRDMGMETYLPVD